MSGISLTTTTYHYIDEERVAELRQNVKDGVAGYSLRGELIDKHHEQIRKNQVRPRVDFGSYSVASQVLVDAWELYYHKIACSENREICGSDRTTYRAGQALVKSLMLQVYGSNAELAWDFAQESGEIPSVEFVEREAAGTQLADQELEIASVEQLLAGDPWKQES